MIGRKAGAGQCAPLAKPAAASYFVGMAESAHIVCPHCDSVNRVPAGRSAAAAKCGVCHKPLFTGHATPVAAAAFDRHIARNDIPVVVDFWAAWCGPCRMMAPYYEEAASAMEPSVRFLKLDTDHEPQISARYNIRGIPTLIVFRDGKPVATRSGAMNAGQIRAWVEQATSAAA